MKLIHLTTSLALCFLSTVTGVLVEDQPNGKLPEITMLKLRAENLVEKVNNVQNLWKAEVHPRFAEMDLASLKRMMGEKERVNKVERRENERIKDDVGVRTPPSTQTPTTRRTRRPRPTRPATTTTTRAPTTTTPQGLPKSFDARAKWPHCADVIGKIQDQSRCGSCWAVAAASAMSDRLCIHSDGRDKTPLSALDILSCETASYGCEGGYAYKAWQWYYDYGVVSGTNYSMHGLCKPYHCSPTAKSSCETPTCKPQCQSDYNVKYAYDKKFAKSYTELIFAEPEEIMEEIFANGPVEASFTVYEDFMHYKSGVYKHTTGARPLGGHAVRIFGWGEEEHINGTVPYWWIANSWNVDWGINGTFKMIRGQNEGRIEGRSINFGLPDLDHLKKENKK